MARDLHDILSQSRRALIVEAGGGGDLISALSVCRLLEICRVEYYLGGIPWERFVFDPIPGPRLAKELVGVEVVSENLAIASSGAATIGGSQLTEAIVSEYLGRRVFLFFLSKAGRQLADGVREAMQLVEADLIVFVDGGGDSLAVGSESGLVSPLADSLSLSAARRLVNDCIVLWAVSGPGCDGELTLKELEGRVSAAARAGGLLGAWGLTARAMRDLESLNRSKRSDVTTLMIESAQGRLGPRLLRQGTRRGETSFVGSVTIFFDPAVVFRLSPLAQAVHRMRSIESANDALHRLRVGTELDLEMSAARRGAQSYSEMKEGGP